MDRDLDPNWRRWVSAEADGRDDEADQAFGTLFAAVPPRIPNEAFQTRVLAAVSRETARQARWAKLAAAGGALIALGLGVVLVLQLPRLFRATVDMSVGAVVWSALAVDRGVDTWTIFA